MRYRLKNSILPIQDNYSTLEKVFARRGISPEDLYHYLNTTEEDKLNPTLLENIQEGIMMLIKHISANDQAVAIVDPDMDGYSSTALFLNYLNRLFPAYTQNNIIYLFHSSKQHGLSDMMDQISNDVKLVIVIDAGSSDFEYHKELQDRGCDVWIVDHHEAERFSEYANVINNQFSYPNKTLSGVGVAYKVCQYIDNIMGVNYADDYVDLAAVGMN